MPSSVGSRVEVLYVCSVCGKGYSSRQGLAGHMNKHGDVEFARLSVRLPREKVERFKEFCKRHKTTTCALINALLTAVEKGAELGVVDLTSANPSIVQVQEFYASKPRGHGKYDTTYMAAPESSRPNVLCLYLDGVRAGEVFCQRFGGMWHPASRCGECPKNRLQKKGEF